MSKENKPLVFDTRTEAEAAAVLVGAEKTLREIEAKRKLDNAAHQEAIDRNNAQAKADAEESENIKVQMQEELGRYRGSQEVRFLIEQREKLEKEARALEKSGEIDKLRVVSHAIAEINEKVPKSVRVDGNTMVIRFRETVKIDSIEEEELPEELFVRVPNKTEIKKLYESSGVVPGVVLHLEMTPYAVETE